VQYQFVDCRWEIGTPGRGRELYLAVHIPGASFLDVDEDLSSPPGAAGSYFDQVPPPEGLVPPYTGREHIVAEDNSAAASYDAPKVTAASLASLPLPGMAGPARVPAPVPMVST